MTPREQNGHVFFFSCVVYFYAGVRGYCRRPLGGVVERLRGLENFSGASIQTVVSSMWEKCHFWVNYPFQFFSFPDVNISDRKPKGILLTMKIRVSILLRLFIFVFVIGQKHNSATETRMIHTNPPVRMFTSLFFERNRPNSAGPLSLSSAEGPTDFLGYIPLSPLPCETDRARDEECRGRRAREEGRGRPRPHCSGSRLQSVL